MTEILAAEALTTEQDTDICEAFRQARSADYEALRRDTHDLVRKLPPRLTGAARQKLQRSLRAFRDELSRIQAIDFCEAPARAAAEAAIETLAARLKSGFSVTPHPRETAPTSDRDEYQRRVWVTRPAL